MKHRSIESDKKVAFEMKKIESYRIAILLKWRLSSAKKAISKPSVIDRLNSQHLCLLVCLANRIFIHFCVFFWVTTLPSGYQVDTSSGFQVISSSFVLEFPRYKWPLISNLLLTSDNQLVKTFSTSSYTISTMHGSSHRPYSLLRIDQEFGKCLAF